MNYVFSKSSLNFGTYGDFTFTGKELLKLKDSADVLYQNIFKFIKSQYQDYELNANYSARLNSNVGKGLDLRLSKNIENTLKSDIISQGLIPKQYLEVYTIIEGSTLHVRVILFSSENYTINLEINNNGVNVLG